MASTINEFAGVCPEDCSTDVVFPPVSTDAECLSYDLFFSQIGDLIIVPDGATDPFGASWTGEGATLTVDPAAIDNAGIDNTTARRLRGIGSLGETEDTTREGPYRQTIIVSRTAPFEFVIDNVNAANRTFAKALQCNPTNFKAYFGTASHIFGKAGGMALGGIDVQMPLDGGTDDVERIIIRADVTWKKTSPERSANNPFV